MPLLPLPSEDTGLAGGDLPVVEDADVLAEFPNTHRRPAEAPVRDTFVSGWAAGFRKYQSFAQRAAGESDPMRATGDYLRSYAEERTVIPVVGESEESVRNRLFDTPPVVSPDAIVAGVKAILEKYTLVDAEVHLSELELDGWFVHDGTPTWGAFVGSEPNYPDRYYAETPYLLPGGAVPSRGLPRSFVIRIPALDANDANIPYVGEVFATTADNGFAVYVDPQLADEIYRQVITFVESVKGQGFSWSLVGDPSLL